MKLMLIDGNSILNRAFYGIKPLTTRNGLYTNAVYGFLQILIKLLSDDNPNALCVCFDLKAPTFRHNMYEAYKATRKGMPDELAVQLPYLKSILDAMNIFRCELEGFEADDLIGTISKKCESEGWECLVVTGDRDSLQLISTLIKVKLVSTRAGKTEETLYDKTLFTEKYGFEPRYLIDFKALMGDPSDNIPGVKGVGEKTALELIRHYKSLDTLFENLENLKPAVSKKLSDDSEMAYLSYKLAEINRNAPLTATPDAFLRRDFDNDKLYELFRELEFSRLIQRFGLIEPKHTDPSSSTESTAMCSLPEIVWTEIEDLGTLLCSLKGLGTVSFAYSGGLEAIALISDDIGFTICQSNFDDDIYMSFLKSFFSPEIQKNTHSVKRLMRVLMALSIDFGGFVYDTELAAYLLSPNENSYNLSNCASKLLLRTIPDAVYDKENAFNILGGTDEALSSLKAHAAAIRDIKSCTESEIKRNGMDALFYRIELPLCRVLADMEHTGFLVDRSALLDYAKLLGIEIDRQQEAIYNLAEQLFNINSPKQLGEILFEKLNLPALSKTKTGYSTAAEVLERLKDKHPIIEPILEYRKLSKLKSTYSDGLLRVISTDGRIHTCFNMTATATGRLSSTEPNLQNIPVRTELGGEFRKMFIAADGCLLIDADYSQIELRILAHISDDQTMLKAFENGDDIHSITASQVFGVAPDKVTPLMRSRAKAVNFGIVYGISDYSLAQDIKVSRSEARQYIDSYLDKYNGVRQYMTDIIKKAEEDGFVSTIFGRRRYLPELKAKDHNTRSFGQRVALNMPIQGSAADIIKLAMVNAAQRMCDERLSARLLLQVHDELIVEAPEDEAETVRLLLTNEMQNVASLKIPLLAEAHIGKTWYESK